MSGARVVIVKRRRIIDDFIKFRGLPLAIAFPLASDRQSHPALIFLLYQHFIESPLRVGNNELS
ncbi:MAG: hypothetical protein AB4290_19915 [Spirulina sp.]